MDKGKKYIATIYSDAAGGYKINPEGYQITKQTVESSATLHLKLASGGGAAVSFMAVK